MIDDDIITLVKVVSPFCFEEAGLSRTGGQDLEPNKKVGQVPTIMRASTSKDGDLISHFPENNESQAEINHTILKRLLVNNHDIVVKRKVKGQLPLKHVFGFCRTCKKILNN